MKIVAVFLLAIAVVWSSDPITVDPDKGDKDPIDLSGTDLTTKYCTLEGKRCDKKEISSGYSSTVATCLGKCSRDTNCLTVFIGEDKICHLISGRCKSSDLVAAKGTDYYRLKNGESCPDDRKKFVAPKTEYSNSFCMLADKACPGNGMYKGPQNIQPWDKCLKRCVNSKACAGVDMYIGEQKFCDPKTVQCSEDELVDAPGTYTYNRLPIGVDKCPPPYEEAVEPGLPSCPEDTVRAANGKDCECASGYKMVDEKCVAEGLNDKCEEVGQADIIFVIDASASVKVRGFVKEKTFVAAVVNDLEQIRPDGNGIRVGVFTFSSQYAIRWGPRLGEARDKTNIVYAINSLAFKKGVTDTWKALEVANAEISAKGRPGVPHVVVTLTDGMSSNEGATVAQANALKAKGVHMMSVGIGTDRNLRMSELDAMADQPLDKFKFIVGDFSLLDSIVAKAKKALFCKPGV